MFGVTYNSLKIFKKIKIKNTNFSKFIKPLNESEEKEKKKEKSHHWYKLKTLVATITVR